MDLTNVPTKILTEELARREGVKKVTAEPYQKITIDIYGPAVVLEVFD